MDAVSLGASKAVWVVGREIAVGLGGEFVVGSVEGMPFANRLADGAAKLVVEMHLSRKSLEFGAIGSRLGSAPPVPVQRELGARSGDSSCLCSFCPARSAAG